MFSLYNVFIIILFRKEVKKAMRYAVLLLILAFLASGCASRQGLLIKLGKDLKPEQTLIYKKIVTVETLEITNAKEIPQKILPEKPIKKPKKKDKIQPISK